MKKRLAITSAMLTAMSLILFTGHPQASMGLDVDEIRSAAEHGDADSQFDLGAMYLKGQGVPQDDVTAYAWSSLAAEQGEEVAARNRDVIAERFTPEQQSQAQALIAELKAKIDGQEKRSASMQFFPASSEPLTADQTEVRAWLQSIKPAAGRN